MIKERINELRKLMKEKNISAYIINDSDPHMSEYVPEYYKTRNWISGFDGSAGTVVITETKAGLWADSRYYIQAAQQIENSGIELFKMGIPHVPTYTKWLEENLNEGDTIGFDGKVFSAKNVESMIKTFKDKNIKVISKYDLISELWKEDRPILSSELILSLDVKYAGKSRTEKLLDVRTEMKKADVLNHLICSLDDIAWLYNIRGKDITYNPVVISYALITKDKNFLFIDNKKISDEIKEEFLKDEVTLLDYSEITNTISSLNEKETILLNSSTTNKVVYDSIPSNLKKIDGSTITTIMKAKKNDIEQTNVRKALLKDGIAMVKFLSWLDSYDGEEKMTEIFASDKLTSFRAEQENNMGTSFNSISAYGEHAALCHYSSTPETNVEIEKKGLYLIDSGGQYLEGTTDITRTIVMGELTDEERTDYTLVLKGYIGIATAKFPEGTTGGQLDILARKDMWEQGINYGHGTGHGVGFFLAVHEGPQNIAPTMNKTAFEPGMLTSNEPGIYREGKHGIRIESLIFVKEDKHTEFGKFYKFETVTLCPIDTRAIEKSMMTEEEIKFLNDYHKEVNEKLTPYVNEVEKQWLDKMTVEI